MQYLQVINQISRIINSTLDSEMIFYSIVENVMEILQCLQVVMYSYDAAE